MLKYLNTDIVFQEVPDETSLAINITGCPCRCPGCHSPHLWGDTGLPLDTKAIDSMMASQGENITCVCFMGGDAAPCQVESLAAYIHRCYPRHKVAWYSGRQYVPHNIDKQQFDYIKVGPYIAHLGSLKSIHSNQYMLKRMNDGTFVNITHRFRRLADAAPRSA